MTWQDEYDNIFGIKHYQVCVGKKCSCHKEVKAFIQDLLDRKAEAYIEKLKNEIDDWYTLPPAYRNKAELKGRLDQAISILKERV